MELPFRGHWGITASGGGQAAAYSGDDPAKSRDPRGVPEIVSAFSTTWMVILKWDPAGRSVFNCQPIDSQIFIPKNGRRRAKFMQFE